MLPHIKRRRGASPPPPCGNGLFPVCVTQRGEGVIYCTTAGASPLYASPCGSFPRWGGGGGGFSHAEGQWDASRLDAYGRLPPNDAPARRFPALSGPLLRTEALHLSVTVRYSIQPHAPTRKLRVAPRLRRGGARNFARNRTRVQQFVWRPRRPSVIPVIWERARFIPHLHRRVSPTRRCSLRGRELPDSERGRPVPPESLSARGPGLSLAAGRSSEYQYWARFLTVRCLLPSLKKFDKGSDHNRSGTTISRHSGCYRVLPN